MQKFCANSRLAPSTSENKERKTQKKILTIRVEQIELTMTNTVGMELLLGSVWFGGYEEKGRRRRAPREEEGGSANR